MKNDDWCPENDGAYRMELAAINRKKQAARDARVRAEALRDAAAIIPNVTQSYGMMKPGKPDQYASREAQIVAKGFARLIEEDILALIPVDQEENLND